MAGHSREILRLAIPSIVSNITVPLLGMVDTTIVGHLGSPAFIAAISLGGTAFSVLYWLFAFLRMSTSGLVSQAFGAADEGRSADVMRKSLSLGMAISAGILLLQVPLFHFVLWLTPARQDVLLPLQTYYYMCVWGAPAILLSYCLSGWFIGRQDTKTPMFAAILQNVVNILLSLFFVYTLDMSIRGVALGTVLGAWSGMLFMLLRLRRWDFSQKSARFIGWGRFFSINKDIFFRTLCLVAVTVYFTRAGSLQREGVLEANAVLMQLFMLFSFFMDGFANAGEALSGRFYGSRDALRLGEMIRELFVWGGGMGIFFSLIYRMGGEWLLSVFTDQRSVLLTARDFLPWIWVMPLAGFAAFLWDGVFIGLTRSRQMFQSMASAMLVFFGLWFSLRGWLGNHALWLAFDAYLLTRGMLQWSLYKKEV